MIASSPKLLNYQPGETVLYRLDPRTKLLCGAGIIAAILASTKPNTLGIAIALAAFVGILAQDLVIPLARALRPLLILIVLFGVLIVVVTPGHAIAHFGFIVATRDGVELAIRLGLQALLILYTTSLLTLTTPPLAVAGSLQWSLGWLERLRLPIRDIIAMVAVGLTFVPLLIEETQRVIAAQRARGASLGMNALLDEESMGALLIPLLLANLRRGRDLADSMDARLYGTGPRTSIDERHFGLLDLLAGLIVFAVVVAIVALNFL